jgi:uncharacterized membrane protein
MTGDHATGDIPAGDLTAGEHEVPFSLERITFFSDAVFAIAITLLALEIRLPESAPTDPAHLGEAILGLAPVLFSYALSFAAIGLYWLAHWRRYDYVDRADEGLAVINLGHLAFVGLIPFPTALLGAHGDQPGPVIVYAVVLSAAGVVGTLAWLYAYRRGLVTPGIPASWVRLSALRGLAVPIVFTAALPLLVVHPFAVEAAWLLVFPVQAVIGRRLRRGAYALVPPPGTRP